MMERSLSAQPATITFTSDFHELARGDLKRGANVRLRYDPLRITPPDAGYVFGDPRRPVIAYARFGGSRTTSVALESAVGMQPDRAPDVTGEGPMLTATVDVPLNAEELELWFSFESPNGAVYDSDHGANFHFGFARDQIAVAQADVVTRDLTSVFVMDVIAVREIDRVLVRIHPAKVGAFPSVDAELETTEHVVGGWRTWTLRGVRIPPGEIVRFKLYYWIGGRRYKEDNDGLYYLAPVAPHVEIPPPPPALAAAASVWR